MAVAPPDLKEIRASLSVVSWLGLISLFVAGKDNKILYLYVTVSILATLLLNSMIQKIFRNRSLPYDYILYHFVFTLALSTATFISTLKLAPYHRVLRSVLKLFQFLPSRTCTSCTCKTVILEDVPVRVYTPLHTKSDVVIVYYHGGLFSYYNLDIYHNWMKSLASNIGCKVVLTGYKLAPEYPFPNAVIEAYQVLNWVQDHDSELGVNRRRVVVMGDEAGGCLAASVTLLHKRYKGRSLLDDTSDLQPPIAGQVLIHPLLQVFSRGSKATLNNSSGVSTDHKALFLSYYIAGNCTFAKDLGECEGSVYPPFWKVCVDDAVKTRQPLTLLKPAVEGVWNELMFPLMSADPTGLPQALIIAFTHDESFDDSRCYSEWLTHHQVPTKLIRDSEGYNGNVLLHGLNSSVFRALDHISDFVDTTIC